MDKLPLPDNPHPIGQNRLEVLPLSMFTRSPLLNALKASNSAHLPPSSYIPAGRFNKMVRKTCIFPKPAAAIGRDGSSPYYPVLCVSNTEPATLGDTLKHDVKSDCHHRQFHLHILREYLTYNHLFYMDKLTLAVDGISLYCRIIGGVVLWQRKLRNLCLRGCAV